MVELEKLKQERKKLKPKDVVGLTGVKTYSGNSKRLSAEERDKVEASIKAKLKIEQKQPAESKKKVLSLFSPYQKQTKKNRFIKIQPKGFFGGRSLTYQAKTKRMTHLQILKAQQKKLLMLIKIKALREQLNPPKQQLLLQQQQLQNLPPPMPLYPWEQTAVGSMLNADINHGEKDGLWGGEAWFGGENYYGEDFFGGEDFSLAALGINLDRRLPSPLLY